MGSFMHGVRESRLRLAGRLIGVRSVRDLTVAPGTELQFAAAGFVDVKPIPRVARGRNVMNPLNSTTTSKYSPVQRAFDFISKSGCVPGPLCPDAYIRESQPQNHIPALETVKTALSRERFF